MLREGTLLVKVTVITSELDVAKRHCGSTACGHVRSIHERPYLCVLGQPRLSVTFLPRRAAESGAASGTEHGGTEQGLSLLRQRVKRRAICVSGRRVRYAGSRSGTSSSSNVRLLSANCSPISVAAAAAADNGIASSVASKPMFFLILLRFLLLLLPLLLLSSGAP